MYEILTNIYLRLQVHKLVVERNKCEVNRTVERQERVQKVHKFTEKHKCTAEEAAMRYYVWTEFHRGR